MKIESTKIIMATTERGPPFGGTRSVASGWAA